MLMEERDYTTVKFCACSLSQCFKLDGDAFLYGFIFPYTAARFKSQSRPLESLKNETCWNPGPTNRATLNYLFL